VNDRTTGAATRILSALLEARTGQQLSFSRSWRIEASLKPLMRELGIDTLDALVRQLTSGTNKELTARTVDALLNNESSFFRDTAVFETLDREVLERLRTSRRATRRLRIWSAACSTGQEAYSLAMLFRDAGSRWAGWTIELHATDVSTSAVARARQGRYSQFEIQRGLPVRTMLRWFEQIGEEWQVDAALRRDVRFATHNLLEPVPGCYDLILCRNVLMYFALPQRTAVLERLSDALGPDGLLVLGAGETVIGQTDRFATDASFRGIYVPVVARQPGLRDTRVGRVA